MRFVLIAIKTIMGAMIAISGASFVVGCGAMLFMSERVLLPGAMLAACAGFMVLPICMLGNLIEHIKEKAGNHGRI